MWNTIGIYPVWEWAPWNFRSRLLEGWIIYFALLWALMVIYAMFLTVMWLWWWWRWLWWWLWCYKRERTKMKGNLRPACLSGALELSQGVTEGGFIIILSTPLHNQLMQYPGVHSGANLHNNTDLNQSQWSAQVAPLLCTTANVGTKKWARIHFSSGVRFI